MDLVTYIREIEHAVSSVMKDIWEDRRIFQDLESRLKGLTNKTEDGYRRIQSLLENDDPDSDLLATAAHWDTYFGVDKDRFHADKELTAKGLSQYRPNLCHPFWSFEKSR